MKTNFKYLILSAFVLILATACGPNLRSPGNFFLRQKAPNLQAFKDALKKLKPELKQKGFLAYSLHRDLGDRQTYILTLKCVDLRQGEEFLRSPAFREPLGAAGVGEPALWSGLDVRARTYENQPSMTGGIVIAANCVKDYPFWQKCFDAEGGHHHADRGYVPSHYSIHHLPGKPDWALVVHEASDVRKAPAFMTSPAMKGVMESTGVVQIEIWYGVNLEQGIF